MKLGKKQLEILQVLERGILKNYGEFIKIYSLHEKEIRKEINSKSQQHVSLNSLSNKGLINIEKFGNNKYNSINLYSITKKGRQELQKIRKK